MRPRLARLEGTSFEPSVGLETDGRMERACRSTAAKKDESSERHTTQTRRRSALTDGRTGGRAKGKTKKGNRRRGEVPTTSRSRQTRLDILDQLAINSKFINRDEEGGNGGGCRRLMSGDGDRCRRTAGSDLLAPVRPR